MEKTNKNASKKFTKEEIIQMINDLFNYYNTKIINESEYTEYFKKFKNLSEDEIEELIMEAEDLGIINIGAGLEEGKPETSIWRPEDLDDLPRKEWEEILKKYLGKRRRI